MGAQIRKELDWFVHDKLSVIILFALPLFLIIIIAAGDFTISDLSEEPVVYIIDEEKSVYSQAFIDTYKNSDMFNMEIHDSNSEPYLVTLENCSKLIAQSKIDAYLIIPSNFSENLINNRSTSLILILDANSKMSALVSNYFSSGSTLFQSQFQVFNSEIVFQPEMRPDEDFNFLIMVLPILLSLLLFVSSNLVASQCIVADDPLKRLLLSPARRGEIILSKSISYIFLGAFLSFISVLILRVIFKVIFASFLNTFLITFFSTIFGVLYGILFSSISKTRLQAAQLSLFFFVLQFTMGIFIRIDPIVNYLPYDIVRQIFIKVAFLGVSLSTLSPKLWEIFIHNVIVLILSVIFYKQKKFDV
ncbi:MAG: hypothetical protein DRO88_10700 [Promethearchaeia archaeon]|nr:MAG: hypothetical protein DRO88_10700 [Candidatus Lokiarchaeia archaeon]